MGIEENTESEIADLKGNENEMVQLSGEIK